MLYIEADCVVCRVYSWCRCVNVRLVACM